MDEEVNKLVRAPRSDAAESKICWRVVAAVAFGILLVSGVLTYTKKSPGEYAVYNRAANRLLHGEVFYRTDEKSAFSYPPFFVLPGIPLTYLPEQTGRFCWYVVNLSLLAISIMLLHRLIAPVIKSPLHHLKPRYGFYLFLIGLLSIRHATSPIENQSHDCFILLFVVMTLFHLGKSDSPKAGIWVGFAAACKATPLLFLPYFLWTRRWRSAIAMVVVITAATLLLDVFFQNPTGKFWGLSWYQTFASHVAPGQSPNAAGAWTDWNILNQSLAGSIFRLTIPLPYQADGFDFFETHLTTLSLQQSRWLTLFAQLSVISLVFYLTFPRNNHNKLIPPAERSFQALGHGAVIVCGMLLISPMTSKSHLCLLLLPISYCVTDYMYRKRSYLMTGLLLLIFITGPLTAKTIVGNFLGNRILGYGFPTWSILFCLLATGVVLKSRAKVLQNRKLTGQFGIDIIADAEEITQPVEEGLPQLSNL